MTSALAPLLADIGDVTARLDRYIDRSGGPSACWPWTGRSHSRGYPVLWVRLTDGSRRQLKVHRLVAELINGEVDETVDHICHDASTCVGGVDCPHRRCENPAHLAPESTAQNARRNRARQYQETCGQGHPIDVLPSGRRYCRTCAADRARERRAAKPAREPGVREYRPRGMTREQLVDWGLEGQGGDGCWHWRGKQPNKGDGYYTVAVGDTTISAHRLVYEVRVGPVPEGYVVDHTCHDPAVCAEGFCPHRACCRPDHLAAVTYRQNVTGGRRRARPDVCKYGHDLADAYIDKRGARHCRQCTVDRQAAAREAEREGRVDQRFRVDGRCRNQHRIADVGLDEDGRCQQCKREARQRYKERHGATQAVTGS